MLPIVEAYMAVKFASGMANAFMEKVDAKHARKWFKYHLVAFVSIGLLMASHPLPNQKQYWSEDHGKDNAKFCYLHIIELGVPFQITLVENPGIG